MKTLIKIFTIIIVLTANAYSEDKHNHDSHDHDNHKKEGFYGHLDVSIFADSMTKVAEDGKYNEIYSHSHAEIGNNFSNGWSINSNIKLEGGTKIVMLMVLLFHQMELIMVSMITC